MYVVGMDRLVTGTTEYQVIHNLLRETTRQPNYWGYFEHDLSPTNSVLQISSLLWQQNEIWQV